MPVWEFFRQLEVQFCVKMFDVDEYESNQVAELAQFNKLFSVHRDD